MKIVFVVVVVCRQFDMTSLEDLILRGERHRQTKHEKIKPEREEVGGGGEGVNHTTEPC